jgi:RND superfamily putative drug exporter
MFGAWGLFVYRFRLALVVLSLASLFPATWLVVRGAELDTSLVPLVTESGRAAALIASELPRGATFELIFSHSSRHVTDPAFRQAIARAIEPLRHDSRVARVVTAYDRAPSDPTLVSEDGRHTRVIIEVTAKASPFESLEFSSVPPAVYESLRRQVHSDTLEVLATGSPALHHDFTQMAESDLRRCELITLPIVLVLLLFVFGSGIAAFLPLAVAGLAMAAGTAGILLLSHLMPVSTYATNLVTMIGLGVAIDYALFIVSRFREEMGQQPDIPNAIASTMATAGRAVIFSGLTVAIGFGGMMLVPIGALASLGAAGTMVVALAVIYSATFLPAVLAILGPRVDALRVPFAASLVARTGGGAWHRIAAAVMDHPWGVLLPVLAALLMLGLPFRAIRLASADPMILPVDAESRRGEELRRRAFPRAADSPIIVVLRDADHPPTSPQRIRELYTMSRWLARLPGITRVESFVDLDPRLDLDQYERLASLPPKARPPDIDAAFRAMVGAHISMLLVHFSFSSESHEARALVRAIRERHPPTDAEVLVSGQTAFDLDFIHLMERAAPVTGAFIVLVTYLILFFLLGSLLLPIKAVLMNLLSITASYGALVWIFQEGHLARWLGFTPGPIELPIPLIMFCVLFGLSMDYEVLLLSRTREEYARTGDNRQAVTRSLERTGALITGAAAIMAVVFFGFGFAHAVMIKAIGIGMGIAVIVDATIVRALLVPATMRLLGDWNWWAPAPLDRMFLHEPPPSG